MNRLLSFETCMYLDRKGRYFWNILNGKVRSKVFEHLLCVCENARRQSKVFAEEISLSTYLKAIIRKNMQTWIEFTLFGSFTLYFPECDKNSRWINPFDLRPKRMSELKDVVRKLKMEDVPTWHIPKVILRVIHSGKYLDIAPQTARRRISKTEKTEMEFMQ